MRYPYEVGQRLARPDPAHQTVPVAGAAVRSAADHGHPRATGLEQSVTLQSQVLGARALAPLYRAVLVRPGLQARREVFAQALETVKRLYQTGLERICQMMQSDEAQALSRVTLAGPVAALVADAWELADPAAAPEVQSREIEHLLELYAKQTVGVQAGPFPLDEHDLARGLRGHSAESVAEYRAVCTAILGLLPVWTLRPATQRLYLADQRPQDVVAHIRLTLTDSAAEIAAGLMPEADEFEQSSAYVGVLEGLGELYRFTLEAQFTELSRRIRDMDAGQKRAYLEGIPQHPGGMLIECTEALFVTVAPGCYTLIEPSGSLPWRGDSPAFELQETTLPLSAGLTPRVSGLRGSQGHAGVRADLGLEYRDGT
jgi:hypothetical protein